MVSVYIDSVLYQSQLGLPFCKGFHNCKKLLIIDLPIYLVSSEDMTIEAYRIPSLVWMFLGQNPSYYPVRGICLQLRRQFGVKVMKCLYA